jgi:hypothetical protein
MLFSKFRSILVFSAILASSQAFATTGIQCQMLNSRSVPDMDNDTLTWDWNGFIPLKVVYGNKGARSMEGSLVKGYWASGKRLWMNITITDDGTENGKVENRIVLKTVTTNSGRGGNDSDIMFKGKAFYESSRKSFDVECYNWK